MLVLFSLVVLSSVHAFCQEQEEKAWVKCYAACLKVQPIDYNKPFTKDNAEFMDFRSQYLLNVIGTNGEEVKGELRRNRNHPDDCTIELDGFTPGNYVFRLENAGDIIVNELHYKAVVGKGGAALLLLEPGKNYVIFCSNHYVSWGSMHGFFDHTQHEQVRQGIISDYLLQNKDVTRDDQGNWFIDGKKATLRRYADFFILNVPNILN